MSSDDRSADRQAEAHAIRLRGDEGLECCAWIVEANPVIRDLDRDMPSLSGFRSNRQPPLHAAADWFQCFERVAHEIEQQLLQLNPIGKDGGRSGSNETLEGVFRAGELSIRRSTSPMTSPRSS